MGVAYTIHPFTHQMSEPNEGSLVLDIAGGPHRLKAIANRWKAMDLFNRRWS
jgi:hypothetical protein